MIIVGVIRILEVVAKMTGEQHSGDVRRRHRRCRVARASLGGGPDAVNPQLLRKLTPLIDPAGSLRRHVVYLSYPRAGLPSVAPGSDRRTPASLTSDLPSLCQGYEHPHAVCNAPGRSGGATRPRA